MRWYHVQMIAHGITDFKCWNQTLGSQTWFPRVLPSKRGRKKGLQRTSFQPRVGPTEDSRILINNVLLVKIEGPVWYTIYHHLPAVKGVNKPLLLINQPMGKGHL